MSASPPRAGTARPASVIGKVRGRARWAARETKRKIASSPLGARSSTRRRSLVGRADQWAAQRSFQFEFLTSHGLRPEHTLIDIGCGSLRGGIPLIEYLDAGNYTGVEVRAEVLQEARKELADAQLAHKRPRLVHAGSPAQIPDGERYDFAWAFMVLIHMPDEVLDSYLGFVSRRMRAEGCFYANVAIDERPDGEWQGFPVVFRSSDFYARAAASHGLAVSELGRLASLGQREGRGGDTMMLRITHARAS